MSAVTVRRCATLNEAHIVCGLLRSHGFEAAVEEANHAANDWFVVQALGGVRVSVPHAQLDSATQLIAEVMAASQQVSDSANPESLRKPRSRYLGVPLGAIVLVIKLFQLFSGT